MSRTSKAQKPRVGIYTRFSSDLQRDASNEDQARLTREHARKQDYEVVGVYADRAVSGASLHRPGMQSLLRDASAGLLDVVLAEALDRYSRSQADVASFFEKLSFWGVRVETVAEGVITEMHIGLKGTMNALFLKDLAQKTHRGLEGRVRDGKSAGGRAYGYRPVSAGLAPDGTPLRGDLAIVEEEAEVVRRIFGMYASGVSPKRIAAVLNEERVPGPRGGPWQFSTVYGNRERGIGILNNELYAGRRVWNRQRFEKDPSTGKRQARLNDEADLVVKDEPDLRIVDHELWEAVKRRQEATSVRDKDVRPEARRRPVHLFSGLMVCGVCGGGVSMIANDRVGCSSARNQGDTVCTNRRTTSRSGIEARVLNALTEHLMDPELVRVFCEEYTAERNRLRASAGATRATKEAELQKIRRDHDKLVQAILDGVAASQLKDRMNALDTRRQQLEAELAAAAPADPVRLHPALAETYHLRVRELVAGLSASDDGPSATESREAVRALVSRIVLTPVAVPGRKLSEVRIDLEGALAGLLHLAAGAKAAAAGVEFAVAVAGRLQAEPGQSAFDAALQNDEEPASGEAGSGLRRQTQGTMVAGAGFEPAAFRL
nr:recombinase family protein [Rubellimicrobium mesophilum]